MASRDSFRLMGALACLGAFLIAGGQPSRGANYDPGTPPSMTAPGEVLPGQGWGLGDLEDIDHYGDGDPTPLYDEVQIVEVTVIDECGNSQPLSGDSAARGDDPPFWGRNIPQRPGTYYVWVKIDDLPKYYDDPPREFFWTIVVRDFHDGPWDCKSCPDRRKPSRPFKGIELVFPLGTTTDGESAGALWLVEYEPRAQLVSPNSVHYDHPSGADGITVSQRDSNGAFYVETPAFRAAVVYVNNHKFEVRLADVGTQTVFRKWVVEEIDGSTIHDDVRVTEYVDDDGTLIVWSKADYDWSENPDPKWTLTTREGADQVLQIEEVTWVDIQSGPPAIKEQRYVRKAPAGTAVYREYIQHTEFAPGWRQTQRVVDPGGADLTTTWSYVLSNGLRLRSEQRPDGSWTYFNQSVGTSLVVENISGWKDQAYVSSPSLTHSGVQGVQLTYPASQNYRLSQVREYLGGALVRAADYSHTLFSGGRTESTTIQNWLDTSGSAKLTSTTYFENHDLTRVNYADFPDGRRDDYTYHDEIQFTSGSSPSYDLNQAGDYNYREVVHGYVNNGALAVVSGKSTKETTILDLVGHPVFEETFVANSGSWVRLDWVYREYDVQGRLTATHRANGTSETTEYSACCGRTVTDAVGVVTTYTDDPLGRPSSFTRAAVSGTGYQTQPAITTEYDYSVPSAVTVAVSAGGLSQTTIREYDLAGRVNSERTANGGGHDLKTLYDYQTTSEGGREVIVYRDYPTDAVSGTEGVRDEITSYFCDGQFKSRTGATVVARYQNYGSAAGERWMITSEGAPAADPPDADDRYEKTTYDMLGRVKAEARPGWAASGTATLTSTYYYDASGADAGLLKRILRSHAAGTLHQYDELAGITYSAVDADNDGTLDLTGPDRVTRAASAYEYDGTLGAWAWVNRSWVLPSSGASTEVLTDVRKQVVPAFLDGVIAESHSFDVAGRETITTTELDSGDHVVTATTNVPGSTTAELRITHGGRLVRTVSATGVESLFGYDALGRRTRTRDGRGNWSVTVLDAQGRPTDEYNGVEDPEQPGTGARTQYGYYAPGSDHPGRLYWVQVPDVTGSTSKKSYYAYNARGQTTQVWGNVPYPTLTAYNAFGEREELTTFRDTTIDFTGATWPGVGENDGDTTTWTIDAATGLVERKTYADGEYVDDTYTAAGQLCTHTWARAGGGLTTTYNYNDGESGETWTGERIGINYSDANTPDVTTGYDRLGRTAWVKDGAGKRQCAYDPNTLALNTETFVDDQDPNIADLFLGKVVTHLYENGNETNGLIARFKGVQVGTSGDPDAHYQAIYGYDAVGRFGTVAGPGLPSGGATYSYWSQSGAHADLVSSVEFRASTTLRFKTAWTYDDSFDRVTAIANTWYDSSGANPAIVSQYGYGHDARGRRTHKQRSGQAFATTPFSGDFYEKYAYNDRDELTGADYYTGTFDTGTAVPANDRIYAYDPIGNRQSARAGESGPLLEYVPNSRNEYHRAGGGGLSQGYRYDEDGNLVELYVAADMNCDGQVGFPDINCFVEAIASCPPNPANYGCDPCPCLNGDLDGDGAVGFSDINYFSSLIPSNGLRRAQTWDAQNRLIAVGPPDGVTPADGAKRLTMKYDHRNRRVWKQVETYTSGTGWQITEQHKFMWDGWLMLLELDALDDDAIVRQYTWGLDLAGQRDGESREAAGGIGGLLAVHDSTISAGVDYLYAYDAGGNVGQAVSVSPATWDASSVLVARYEYDPYGAVTAQAGTYAATNPIRWSTKYWDAETALGYWGERWYDAGMGRWTSGDPIGESGGHNLFAYAMNQPVGHVDPDGRFLWGCNAKPQPPPRNPCDDCWQTCKDNQGLLAGDGGGWICRDDGCRCACVNDTAFPPTGQPDDEALRKCALAHEEDHVSRDGTDCSCSPKPCRGGSKPGTRKDRECYASAAEINCLCGERQSCGTDTNCTKRINDRIKQMEDYCKGFGGDVYKHGAKSCP